MERKVKIGIIGLGQRGMATVERYFAIHEAEIIAVSDLLEQNTERARQLLLLQGRTNISVHYGEHSWRSLCQNPEIDLVLICTDWSSHTRMAVNAMQQGKDVAIEVPAATSVEECWQLVHTAHETGRRCTMLENCCYDTFHLGIMQMKAQGLFGEINYCEGAYIHDLRSDQGWMSYTVSDHMGNPYPTHGLGPACQLLDINQTDRLVSLVSMSATNKINNSLIRTAQGRSILLQFDERTPRPYSRMQTLCATKAYVQKYPLPTLQIDGEPLLTGMDAERRVESYHDAQTRQLIKEGRRLDVPNLMNYIMDRRLIAAVLQGKPFDISVYDAALWSSVTELSARSVQQGSKPVDIPDFTQSN